MNHATDVGFIEEKVSLMVSAYRKEPWTPDVNRNLLRLMFHGRAWGRRWMTRVPWMKVRMQEMLCCLHLGLEILLNSPLREVSEHISLLFFFFFFFLFFYFF